VFGVLDDSFGVRTAILTGAGLFALVAIGIQRSRHLAELDVTIGAASESKRDK